MDVEKTIQHILEMQAQNEVRWAKAGERWEKEDQRWANVNERLEKVEKLAIRAESRAIKTEHLIAALTKIVQEEHQTLVETIEIQRAQGDKIEILIDSQIALTQTVNELAASQKELAASQKELAASQKELAASQKETDRKLQAYFDSLREGRNGH
jgi:hypothetical protein